MILLTTGKGGVGKTTIAAASGLALARQGLRTVVVSVDPAHSLADVLDRELGADPVSVAAGLDAMEVRLSAELHARWGDVHAYLTRLMRSQGVERWVAEDIAWLPGLEELAGLMRLRELSRDYEAVVVDCPPTGSTLRLLALPEAVDWYMRRFFPLERRIVEAVGPLAERIVGLPMPDRPVFEQVVEVWEQLEELRGLLTDPSRTVAQVVSTAERVVLAESERAVGYLMLHEIAVGRVVLNRSAGRPDPAIAARVAPLPLLPAPLCGDEPVGVDALEQLAAELFATRPVWPEAPARIAVELEETAGGAMLRLGLPRPSGAHDLRVGRRGDDLILDWGPARRHLPLPPAFATRRLHRAAWEHGGLQLEFADV